MKIKLKAAPVIKFIIFIFLLVLVSYGQMLSMYVYQDDNAIFVKLANLEENAGFLGPGPLGEGPYKYSATPYIPIYYFFGYNTVAYYGLAFVLYFLASVSVYLVFSKVVNKTAGRVSGFLFATGYIASDGFFRLYNTVTTSFTVILASLIFYCYWKFYQSGKLKWYLFSLPLFLAAIEFGQSRTHYLIGVVVLFELVFLTFKKPLRSLFFSVLRLSPFVLVFYRYFLQNADSRSGQINQFITGILRGEFFQSFGLLTTLTNMVIPDWLTNFSLLRPSLLILSSLFWKIGGKIFRSPMLDVSEQSRILILLGCSLIFVIFVLAWAIKDIEKKKIFIFLSLWMLVNIVAYSAYMPLITYESIHRYLAHSFLPLVGILGLLAIIVKKRKLRSAILAIILLWGVGNLSSAYTLQKNIISDRSIPSRSFYQQLRSAVPQITKGDILYFDVADDARQRFADAITVSQMPDTASLAWKYGVDRYDFKRFVDFDSLAKEIKEKNSSGEEVYTFFYDGNSLINTTEQFRKMLSGDSAAFVISASLPKTAEVLTSTTQEGIQVAQGNLEIGFLQPVSGIFPLEVEAEITAKPVDYSKVSCPCFLPEDQAMKNAVLGSNMSSVFDYQRYKNNFYQDAKINTSSQWQERVAQNILDGDSSTVWQADRILWHPEKVFISVDIGKTEKVNRLVWVNGFANNTPTAYSVLVSKDGVDWQTVKQVSKIEKIEDREPQVVEFETAEARFVKMIITETISKDSPAVAEIWVVPAKFSDLEIAEAEKIIKKPFAYLPLANNSLSILNSLNYQGLVKFYWKSNKHDSWMSKEKSLINVTYDGTLRRYKFVVPAGGTEISAIKLVPVTIPGEVTVSNLSGRYLSVND